MTTTEHFTPPPWWPIPALYVLRGGAVVEGGDCDGPIDTPSALPCRPEGWDYLGELLHTPLRGAEFPPGEPLDSDGPEVTASHTHPQRLMILLAVGRMGRGRRGGPRRDALARGPQLGAALRRRRAVAPAVGEVMVYHYTRHGSLNHKRLLDGEALSVRRLTEAYQMPDPASVIRESFRFWAPIMDPKPYPGGLAICGYVLVGEDADGVPLVRWDHYAGDLPAGEYCTEAAAVAAYKPREK